MAIGETVQGIENPPINGPEVAPDDLAVARREADERANLERQIDFAIAEINANPNIPNEIKDELVGNLRSLKTGLGLNSNLAQVQKEINDTRANASFAGTSNAIYNALSAASQAAVDARVNALSEGRFADYALSVIDPDNLYSDATKAHLRPLIDNDPEVQKQAGINRGFSRGRRREAEAQIAANEEWLNGQIANTEDPQKRHMLTMARNAGLMRDPSDADAFMEAWNAGDMAAANAVINSSIHEQAERMEQRVPRGSELYNRLHSNPAFQTEDGYGVDWDKVVRYSLEHKEEIANAMNKRTRREALTPREAQLSSLGDQLAIMDSGRALEGQNFYATRIVLSGHPELPAYLVDKNIPLADRAHQLEVLLIAQWEQSNQLPKPTPEQIGVNARSMVAFIDSKPEAINDLRTRKRDGGIGQEAFLEKYKDSLSQSRINSGLSDMGFDKPQITKLNKIAKASPELGAIMSNSFLSVRTEVMTEDQQKRFFTNVVLGGGPSHEAQEAISITKYYNLGDQPEGSALRLAIYKGEIEPSVALEAVRRLQEKAIARMENFSALVPEMVADNDDYTVRLKNLKDAEGNPIPVMDGNGVINVRLLIETARINRDRLDANAGGQMSDADLQAIASKPYNELTDEQKDTRVVARTAARFKAIEAIQVMASNLNSTFDNLRSGAEQSAALQQDSEMFRKIMDSSNPTEQRAALTELLSRQQYFQVAGQMRDEVISDIATLIQQRPELMVGADFLSGDRINLSAQQHAAEHTRATEHTRADAGVAAIPPTHVLPATPVVPSITFTPEEIRLMANEGNRNLGDTLFENAIEDRVKKALTGKSMADIVAIFRDNVTGVDLLGMANVGNKNNITGNEIENALQEAANRQAGKVLSSGEVVALFDTADANGKKDGQLSIEEIVAGLSANGQLATSIADGQGTTVAAATSAAPAGVPQVVSNTGPAAPQRT